MPDTPPDAVPGRITAYQINRDTGMHLLPAPVDRAWMDQTPDRFGYRCLPLNIANQNGWFVTCPVSFDAYWYGTGGTRDVEFRFDGPPHPYLSSHFGSGVITFSVPYLFRTPPGVNLWVKGPANLFKDGIQPLEGVVETDWAVSTFTMNWKLTRPFHWVRFEAGEPFCMIVPVARGLTEGLAPALTRIDRHPAVEERYRHWERSRRQFLTGLDRNDPEAMKRGWQKDYFRGKTPAGDEFDPHQTRLAVKPFPLTPDADAAPAG